MNLMINILLTPVVIGVRLYVAYQLWAWKRSQKGQQ